MDSVIISGGNINSDFALDFLKKKKEKVLYIAADRGLEFCSRNGLIPDWAVGDFDSVSPQVLKEFEQTEGLKWKKLRPEKDDSDTQSAVNLAMELGCESIEILGATGNRVDHVMANLGLLAYGCQKGIPITLVDDRNWISILRSPGTVIKREEQFGKFVSFFPFGGDVKDLTLQGFKYPLNRYHLPVFDSGLTVSNEIVEDEAVVEMSSGMMLMIMSRD